MRWPADRASPWIAAFLALCIVLGGASRENELQLLALQLTSLPFLAMGLYRLLEQGRPLRRASIWLLIAILALPLLQLAPLPPGVWDRLPGRDEAVAVASLAGLAPHWAPLSLTPLETFRSFLYLLPPAAVFLCGLSLSSNARQLLAMVIVALAGVSLLLGLAQVASGEHTLFYPYRTTNIGAAVGLFANRNHQVTLFLCAIPLMAALSLAPAFAMRGLARAFVGSLVVALFVVGLAAARSRAGVILAGPVVLASVVLVFRTRPSLPGAKTALVAGAIAAATLVLIGEFGLSAIVRRFEEPTRLDTRELVLPAELRAGSSFSPLGAGLGAFVPVYQMFEPTGALDLEYLNHAHNDYVELWIETGWAGPLLLLAFAAWFVWRAVPIWRGGGDPADIPLARAASIVIAVVLLHSAVDYPIRTPAIAAVFAFACAVLASARPQRRRGGRPDHGRRSRDRHQGSETGA